MISPDRVIAVTLRYFYSTRRNMTQLIDIMYWPFMDLLLFGYISIWMSVRSGNVDPLVTAKMLSCLVFWQVLYRGNLEVSLAVLEDIWSRNLINLFSSPLILVEWIIGVMILTLIKTAFAAIYGAAICWLIYGVNVFAIGPIFFVYMLLAIMGGWILGFMGSAVIISWGEKAQSVAWAMGWFFAPFSAVYYPLEVLPHWMQSASYGLPMAHMFESLRSVIGGGDFVLKPFIISGLLSVIYGVAMILFFWRMFERSRSKGLESLYS